MRRKQLKTFRGHIRARLSTRRLGTLRRYSSFQISAKQAMQELGMTCLESLMRAAVRVGMQLPKPSAVAVRVMVNRFLDIF